MIESLIRDCHIEAAAEAPMRECMCVYFGSCSKLLYRVVSSWRHVPRIVSWVMSFDICCWFTMTRAVCYVNFKFLLLLLCYLLWRNCSSKMLSTCYDLPLPFSLPFSAWSVARGFFFFLFLASALNFTSTWPNSMPHTPHTSTQPVDKPVSYTLLSAALLFSRTRDLRSD